MKRVKLGHIYAHAIGFQTAIDEIINAAKMGDEGYVVTPNVDHVVLAEDNPELVAAYGNAFLSLADGMPLIWLAKAMGHPLPEKVSGSDLTEPLLARCANENLRVYFLGGMPGVGERAANILRQRYPTLNICGIDAPPLGFDKNTEQETATLEKLRNAAANIVLFALGCPKQELLMHRWKGKMGGAIGLGIGATLDFIAGEVKRAPPWMSNMGAEWLFRLGQDPKRLAKRYLVRDTKFLPIAMRMLRTPKAERAY